MEETDVGEEERVALARQKVEQLVEENAVVVFSESGCCMCHVVKRLLCSLGVSPTVHELDHHADGAYMEKALRLLEQPPPPPPTQQNNNGKNNNRSSSSAADTTAAVPTVFVGGKLLGGLDKVLATHVSGDLVPQLKQAGALWLWKRKENIRTTTSTFQKSYLTTSTNNKRMISSCEEATLRRQVNGSERESFAIIPETSTESFDMMRRGIITVAKLLYWEEEEA